MICSGYPSLAVSRPCIGGASRPASRKVGRRSLTTEYLELHYFRDQLIAAPLKRRFGRRTPPPGAPFPRSADRGPIEATWCLPRATAAAYFRDQLIAAPLKLIPAARHQRDDVISAIS